MLTVIINESTNSSKMKELFKNKSFMKHNEMTRPFFLTTTDQRQVPINVDQKPTEIRRND